MSYNKLLITAVLLGILIMIVLGHTVTNFIGCDSIPKITNVEG
jgi:uncharacterized membrane protein YwzB